MVVGGPSIDVVIVAYRSRELLRRCLESLDAYPAGFLRIVVVDNDSRDGTVELVRTEFPEVQVVESGTNVGFARATNAGIRVGHAPFVLALNPDTSVPTNVLERLLEVFNEHPDVGICGCRLVREDGSFDHASRRSFPTVLSSLGHFTGLGRRRSASARLAAYRAPDVDEGVVDAVNGAFMLMRRAALDEVGLFDEGYWMYMEDLDLCYRFREAGWSTWYEPSRGRVARQGRLERAGPEPEVELRISLRDVSLLPKALRTPVSGGPQRARLCRDLRQAARLVDEKRVAHLSPKRAATWLPTQRASLMNIVEGGWVALVCRNGDVMRQP